MMDIVQTPQREAMLLLELAIITIVAKPLVTATYILVGDDCTTVIAYDMLQELRMFFTIHAPNLSFPGITQAIDTCVEIVSPLIHDGDRALGLNEIQA